MGNKTSDILVDNGKDTLIINKFSRDREIGLNEYKEALELCVDALYEASEKADLYNMPHKLTGAIQQAQYVLGR